MKENINFERLQNSISGQVITNKEILEFYSRDASSFRIKPKVVVIPKHKKDVATTVRFAKRYGIPITPRGAGTGLVGGALGHGIILDMKNLDSIKIKKDQVIVGPGVFKGVLDKELKQYGKFFPVNPSIGPYCSIGGMIANNASGSRSLKYGSMIDNVIAIEYINNNGKTIHLPRDVKVSKNIIRYARKISLDKFPNVSKNSCGYRLDKIIIKSDTHRLIVGSEGTLGIITSAKLAIKKIPKNRILIIIEYQDLNNAAKDVTKILKTKPVAIEIVDKTTLKNIKFRFLKSTKCLLFVEYDTKIMLPKIEQETHIFRKEEDINRWWKYRDSALYHSLKSIPEQKRIPNIIEDAAVPVKHLSKLVQLIEQISEKYECKATVYGHAGNGNIHVRLSSKNITRSKIESISKEFFRKIIEMEGTITAEHGDGISRTKFVKEQYGNKNYRIFKRLKHEFDPNNLLNPGKIILK